MVIGYKSGSWSVEHSWCLLDKDRFDRMLDSSTEGRIKSLDLDIWKGLPWSSLPRYSRCFCMIQIVYREMWQKYMENFLLRITYIFRHLRLE